MRVQKQTLTFIVNWFATKEPRQFNGGILVLSTNDAGTWCWISTCKSEVGPLPHTIHKNHSIQIKDLNIRPEIGKGWALGARGRRVGLPPGQVLWVFYNNHYYLFCLKIQRLTSVSNRSWGESVETGRVSKGFPSLLQFICFESWWE